MGGNETWTKRLTVSVRVQREEAYETEVEDEEEPGNHRGPGEDQMDDLEDWSENGKRVEHNEDGMRRVER